jgi:hypothetical protein
MSMTENPKIEETREAGEDLLGSKFEIANRSRLEGTCSFLDYAKEDDLDTHLLSTHPLYKYAFRVKWTGFLLTVSPPPPKNPNTPILSYQQPHIKKSIIN